MLTKAEDPEGQKARNCRDKGTKIDDHKSSAVGPSNRDFTASQVMNSQEWPLNFFCVSFPSQLWIHKTFHCSSSLLWISVWFGRETVHAGTFAVPQSHLPAITQQMAAQ
jgi:hypothetical protein